MAGTIKKLQFLDGVDTGAPSDLSAESSTVHITEYVDDAAFVTANGTAQGGDTYLNTTFKCLRQFTNGAWRNVVSESDAADPTKKFKVDLTGGTTAKSVTLDFNHTDNRTYSFPDSSGPVGLVPAAGVVLSDGSVLGTDTDNDVLNMILPLQTGNAGKALVTDGSNADWQTVSGGGGSGSGEVNAILNPSESTGWVASGGGVAVSTTATTGQLPLEPATNTAIRILRASGSNYVRYRFTMPPALKERKLKIQFAMLPDSGYVSGDCTLDMYTNTASNYAGSYVRLQLSSDLSSVTDIPNGTGVFTTYFDTADLDYYELRINALSGTSALNIVSVIVGPGIQPSGAIVSVGDTYQATVGGLGAGTTVASTVIWERVGDSLHMTGRVQKDGTPGTGSAYVTLSLPPGLHINTNRITSVNLGAHNFGSFNDFSNSRIGYVSLQNDGIFQSVIFVKTVTSAPLPGSDMNAGYEFSFNAVVPIIEFEGTGNLNLGTNDQLFISTSGSWDASTGAGNEVIGSQGATAGAPLTASRTKTINVPIAVTQGFTPKLMVRYNGVWMNAATWATSYQEQNGESYGYVLYPTATANQWEVVFGQYKYPTGATYGAAGAAWDIEAWVVHFEKAGVAVGFSVAGFDRTAGLYKAGYAPGVPADDTIIVGALGEHYKNVGAAAAPTSGVWDNTAQLTLDPGDWDCSGIAEINPGGSPTTSAQMAISIYSGNTTTDHVRADNQMWLPNVAAGQNEAFCLPTHRISLSTQTIVYLKINTTFGGSMSYNARLSARRAR